jgi:hypothetical protein
MTLAEKILAAHCKKGVQRGIAPLLGVWGYPPIFSSPPRLGETEGVDLIIRRLP